MLDSRCSDNEISRRDIPSFIEPRPPLISNPFMRPRPQKGTNLLELFEEDSECEEPELVQVYLRLKPCSNPSNLYEVRSDRFLITSLDTATVGHGRRTQHNVSKMYTFSQIFGPETNQKEIFENVVKDNLKKLPEGNSFTLLTYGASGSGKTFTLMGTVASPGLVPRSLEYVFKMVDAAQTPLFKPSESGADKLSYVQQEYELQWMKRLQISAPLKDKYRRMSVQLRNDLAASHLDLSSRSRHYVWVSFIEIYNEGIYDLLAPGERRNAQKLAIREDSSGNVYVKGATQVFVRSGEEAYDIMVAGKHNLQVAATGVHAQSSRSHCIFTITMLTEGENGVSTSHVRLCDLAGCERAARTRNTGARMCESRAINSSLHVLERCLRALRRRRLPPASAPPSRASSRRELIPYRESKLTRLLGSGLSGARGEAVGMVVTLNPSPEYANETRHVLQLAAVAKDIQINNTLSEYPSSLEITQDTTIEFSAEVMKLRADNERLHFELLQAQTRNKELLMCMEQRQAAGADEVKELVDEARDITRHYYEEQLRALRDEMEEMAQEYESKLNAAEVPKLQTKIDQLMTDIAILEEKLTAEKLARGRVEEEVQHLRACIEERDEKADEGDNDADAAVSLTDSDSEEDDPANESLEPTFRKEDINKSRLLLQSAIQAEQSDNDNSVLDQTNDTLKDDGHAYESNGDVSPNGYNSSARESVDYMESNICTVKKANIRDNCFVQEIIAEDSAFNVHTKLSRETYCITDNSGIIFNNDELKIEEHRKSVQDEVIDKEDEFPEFDDKIVIDKQPNSFVNKIISSIKKSTESNNSLAQFERLELATKTLDDKLNTTEVFTNINILKEKRIFFDNEAKLPATKERKIYFDNLNLESKTFLDVAKPTDDYRSPSIVKEEITHDFTPSMIKKLLGESKRQNKSKICTKTHDSIDLFECDSPQILSKIGDVETGRKSVANIEISDKIETHDKESTTFNKESKEDETVGEAHCSENIVHKDMNQTVHMNNTEIEINNIETDVESIIKHHSPCKNEVSSKEVDVRKAEGEHIELKIDNEVRESLKPKRSYFADEIKIENTTQKSEDICKDISKKPEIEEEKTTLLNENLLTKQNNEDSQSEMHNTNVDNTIEQFDNIYKDVTAPNATDFELLLSQEIQESSIEDNTKNNNSEETDDVKYNLRNKKTDKPKPDTKKEIKDKPKRMTLRLRRRKNPSEDEDSEKEVKFKDIVNLQSEFSDVTMDMPAPVKTVKDIPSPEKLDDENLPPYLGIQSCPSKSVTRSRRKLFTPRAEPLDESAGDSNERVCVPRPSYHRPRARRKL